MWILSAIVWILWVRNFCRGNGLEQDNSEGSQRSKRGLRPVTSVEDLLELIYPKYALVQRCLRRRSLGAPSPQIYHDDVTWGNHREAALNWDDKAIQVIIAEIERTACRPREVCLEVSGEYPESPKHIYVPRCVSVHRCGGCCTHEALRCYNSSYQLINKTLLELSPSQMERSVVMVTFVNHTACECRPKRPLHTVIRREVDAHRPLCSPPDVPCAVGQVWDPTGCQCVQQNSSFPSEPELGLLNESLLAQCGAGRVLDPRSCECSCQNGLTESSCGAGRQLDDATCACVCSGPEEPCPHAQRWDPERCACECPKHCPRGLSAQPGACLCQCKESPQSCLLQGRRFNPHTCSCYRLPCRTPYRKCPPDFFFSHFVCSCLPDHMRTEQLS
ncbi:hypothetical protein GJAV_G00195660 [Gymnothorax javanicus]|nr:hypothetical protein GJAV_G00195660 [Gymnothorax javanicus]